MDPLPLPAPKDDLDDPCKPDEARGPDEPDRPEVLAKPAVAEPPAEMTSVVDPGTMTETP